MSHGDDELAERRMLERLADGKPPASDEEAAARRPYERLVGEIADLPGVDPPAGWQERVLAAGPAQRRRGWLVAGVAVLAAAAVLVLLLRARQPGAVSARLVVDVMAGDVQRAGGDATIGDRLVVSTVPGATYVEIRVYHADRNLVLRCPDGPGCRRMDGRIVGELVVREPGVYRVVLLQGEHPLPPPTPAGVDSDLAAVLAGSIGYEEQRIAVD